uniref:Uncharacterized protein n=1 Tax=Haemonchus placei TaxID=6290 RepID=A0A0N4WY80_HAEPC
MQLPAAEHRPSGQIMSLQWFTSSQYSPTKPTPHSHLVWRSPFGILQMDSDPRWYWRSAVRPADGIFRRCCRKHYHIKTSTSTARVRVENRSFGRNHARCHANRSR